MKRILRPIAVMSAVLTAVVASAAPAITSVTPNTSPVGGGIHVTPGIVDVTTNQFDGSGAQTAPGIFTFIGDPSGAFERILLPIYVPPVRGAFGSEFVPIFARSI